MQVDAPVAPDAKPKKPRAPRKSKSSSTHADLTIGPPSAPEVEAIAGSPDAPSGDVGLVDVPQVEEATVKTLLRGVAGMTSTVVGRDDVENHWRFTERELDDITPPLTRIINKRPQVRAAVVRGDEAAVALVLAQYTGRNVAAARKAAELEEKKNAEQQRKTDSAARAVATNPDARSAGTVANGRGGSGLPGTAG